MCAQNIQLPPASMASPDCVGHLMKLGHRAKEWQRRLCLLKDACLYFYVDINVSCALGIWTSPYDIDSVQFTCFTNSLHSEEPLQSFVHWLDFQSWFWLFMFSSFFSPHNRRQRWLHFVVVMDKIMNYLLHGLLLHLRSVALARIPSSSLGHDGFQWRTA